MQFSDPCQRVEVSSEILQRRFLVSARQIGQPLNGRKGILAHLPRHELSHTKLTIGKTTIPARSEARDVRPGKGSAQRDMT